MDQQNIFASSIHFFPAVPVGWLIAAGCLGIILLAFSFMAYRRHILTRFLTFCAFLLALMSPSLLQEERDYVKDVAVIVVDESASTSFGQRKQRTEKALHYIEEQINATNRFDLRVINAPDDHELSSRTDLFGQLDQGLGDISKNRRAGVIFLTDGQVHDVPQNTELFENYGPVHVLLNGEKSEKDRQIVVTHAPAYGLVGKKVTVKYKIEDSQNINRPNAQVTLTQHDGSQRSFVVPVGQEQSLSIPLDHPSQNIFSLEVEPVTDEITQANNKTALIINGVRDRLKVLLISGVPHAGERTWRDLLTSDPGVDLVHFTILREPQKFDYTPKHELSLIAFPFRELFEVKLYDFDLIIFDHYKVNNILPSHYFENIARYVREGGAFLESSGTTFATQRSIYNTPLGSILPGQPTGEMIEKSFVPSLTDLGHQHPVTKSLVWKNKILEPGEKEHWGSWLRYIDIIKSRGDVLMNSMGDKPLLILDRVGKGRVAQLSSDHIWLWSRGYDGGGPHAELLRRIVHWLMKEPELDDRALDITVRKNSILIRKQNHTSAPTETLAVTLPDGSQDVATMTSDNAGFLELKYKAKQLGIYAFEDVNGARKFAIIGEINPPELRGVLTTEEKLSPLVQESGGAMIWLEKTPQPRISSAYDARRYGGSNWLALRQNKDYTVIGVKNIALLPEWAMLLLLLSMLMVLWWHEGKSQRR